MKTCAYPWAAWYNIWLLITLMPKGVVFCSLCFSVCAYLGPRQLEGEEGEILVFRPAGALNVPQAVPTQSQQLLLLGHLLAKDQAGSPQPTKQHTIGKVLCTAAMRLFMHFMWLGT